MHQNSSASAKCEKRCVFCIAYWNSPASPDTLRRCQYVTGGGKWRDAHHQSRRGDVVESRRGDVVDVGMLSACMALVFIFLRPINLVHLLPVLTFDSLAPPVNSCRRRWHRHLNNMNMLKRLDEELRRRARVIRNFSNADAASSLRLTQALRRRNARGLAADNFYLDERFAAGRAKGAPQKDPLTLDPKIAPFTQRDERNRLVNRSGGMTSRRCVP